MAAAGRSVGTLEALLSGSRTLLAAQVDEGGRIVWANAVLHELAGQDPHGMPVEELVAEPQRPALRGHIADAGAEWQAVTLGFSAPGSATAQDRLVHVCREHGLTLLVAEPHGAERDGLLDQVLQVNDDLIASRHDLHRRNREAAGAEDAAHEAEVRSRRLEAVVLAGFGSAGLDVALRRLLVLAREALSGERAAILLTDDAGTLRVQATLNMDDALGDAATFGTGVSGAIAATGRGMVFDDIAQAPGLAPKHRRYGGSLAGVPLWLEGEVIGVLHVSTPVRGRFGPGDLRVLEAVGERAALAIGHAQLREREQRIAETLQRSLLPRGLPAAGDLAVCARYLPRGGDGVVGGDFYDVMPLPGERVGLAIGDVAGKGLTAASSMGQVRAALHAYALEDASPGSILARLDRFVTALDVTATAMLAIVEPGGEMLLASAGHPPAVLADASGARAVTGALGPPLGSGVLERDDGRVRLPDGARLLLYTDGLVERRGESLDAGIEALRTVVESAPRALKELCDRVLEAMDPGGGWPDDIAVLAATRGIR